MTQEHIMKRRMVIAIMLMIAAVIAMLVFLGLFVDEKRRVQETYRTQFNANLADTVEAVDSFLKDDNDKEFRYRRILSDMAGADSFAFLLENLTEEQKIAVNELHSCLIKYPEQMKDKTRLADMRQALVDMGENLDKGFEEAKAVVDAIDRKGH
ncbi:MAG: hypothetical protein IK130_11500 [Oscillospiraceae bacterium]|nr:hypothetical protein [Oscillospiraceae bacterium]